MNNIREQLLALADELTCPAESDDAYELGFARGMNRAASMIRSRIAAEPVDGEFPEGAISCVNMPADGFPGERIVGWRIPLAKLKYGVSTMPRDLFSSQPDSAEGDYRVMQCPNCPTGLETADKGDVNCIRCGAVMELDETAAPARLRATDIVKGADTVVGDINEMAESWLAVCDLLDEIAPDWTHQDKVGRECALYAIRRLSTATHDEQTKPEAGTKAQLIAKLSDALTNNLYNGGLSWQDIADARDHLSAAPQPVPDYSLPFAGIGQLWKDLHPQTILLVRRFAYALAEKLKLAQDKYGYSDGWLDADWMDECRAKLREHVEKGDPRDVAAYCAFLWHHNESTAQPEQPARDGAEPVIRIYAEGSYCVVTEWMDGAKDLPNGDHLLYAQPPQQPARDGVVVDKVGLADKIADDLIKLAPRTYDNPTMLRRDLRMLIGGYVQLYTQPPQQADGGAVATVPNSSDRTVYLDKALPAGTKLYAAQPPKSPGIGGDEAMVDRACIAWMEDSIDEWESLSNISRNTIRAGMSRALLAALGGEK